MPVTTGRCSLGGKLMIIKLIEMAAATVAISGCTAQVAATAGDSAAMAVKSDAQQFARELNRAGYATDPSYASKLIGLMDRYDLYQFDE